MMLIHTHSYIFMFPCAGFASIPWICLQAFNKFCWRRTVYMYVSRSDMSLTASLLQVLYLKLRHSRCGPIGPTTVREPVLLQLHVLQPLGIITQTHHTEAEVRPPISLQARQPISLLLLVFLFDVFWTMLHADASRTYYHDSGILASTIAFAGGKRTSCLQCRCCAGDAVAVRKGRASTTPTTSSGHADYVYD